VAQLAARGIVSGYPDGSFKGGQPSTRYELASIVARALAKADLEHASKQDVELLKKLIVEFKDELDALGVKVDQLDERVAVLEKDLGGWSLAGQLRFDAKFTGHNDRNNYYGNDAKLVGKNEFDQNWYRIWIRKRINETTNFTARLGAGPRTNNAQQNTRWEYFYVNTKLPYDIDFTVGLQPVDLEGDLGLYNDNDAYFGDIDPYQALKFAKSWGIVDFALVFARPNDNGAALTDVVNLASEYFLIATNINVNFNEKVRAGLL
jgi:hypothetical protein